MSFWLCERLAQWAQEGDAPALIWHDQPTGYADLLAQMAQWEETLKQRGIGTGSVVGLVGSFSPSACALLLALIAQRAITVVLAAPSPALLELAEAQWLFCVDEKDGVTLTEPGHARTHRLYEELIAQDRPGLVIFSSGSSGTPKAILHDFEALLAKFQTPRQRKMTLGFLLFDHIGGLDTLFGTLASGGTLVATQRDRRDPEAVCAAIARHKVHTLPTSPTFLNLVLLSEAYVRHDLSSLAVITYGTEPMPERTLTRLHEVLPGVALVQTYGLSELGVLRSRSKDSGSLWVRFADRDTGFETQIRGGVLWVRSASAMCGYLNAPELFDPDGWLNTQDAVELDESGEYLRILGRVTDLINVGGQKVYPTEVESVLLELGNVRDVAVAGEANLLTGQIVTARFQLCQPEELAAFKRRLRTFCQGRLAPYQTPVRITLTEEALHGARFKKLR